MRRKKRKTQSQKMLEAFQEWQAAVSAVRDILGWSEERAAALLAILAQKGFDVVRFK